MKKVAPNLAYYIPLERCQKEAQYKPPTSHTTIPNRMQKAKRRMGCPIAFLSKSLFRQAATRPPLQFDAG